MSGWGTFFCDDKRLFLNHLLVNPHAPHMWTLHLLKDIFDSLRLPDRKLQLLTVCQLQGQVLGDLIGISIECSRNILRK